MAEGGQRWWKAERSDGERRMVEGSEGGTVALELCSDGGWRSGHCCYGGGDTLMVVAGFSRDRMLSPYLHLILLSCRWRW
ncbi:unnamed protein product [Calypogeia fissa]